MKKLLLIGLCLAVYIQTTAQATGVAINNTGDDADVSAMLDVSSTDKGFLFPRMTQAQRDLILLPATGLMIFQLDGTPGVYLNGGTPAAPTWVNASGANSIDDLSDGVSNGTTTFFLGTGAGASNTVSGNNNTALGINALNANKTGSDNTAIGFNARSGGAGGNFNTVVGKDALLTGGGSDVTAIGYKALESSTSSTNVAVGSNAGGLIVSGVNNTFIGAFAGDDQTGGTGNIVLGSFANLADLAGNNQINLGNVIYATSIGSAGARIGVGNSNVAPNSTLDVGGSLSVPVTSVQLANYTVLDSDHTIIVGNSFTITLPDPVGISGRVYVIKRVGDTDTTTVVSAGSGAGADIDGVTSQTLVGAWKYMRFQSTGDTWIIIGQN